MTKSYPNHYGSYWDNPFSFSPILPNKESEYVKEKKTKEKKTKKKRQRKKRQRKKRQRKKRQRKKRQRKKIHSKVGQAHPPLRLSSRLSPHLCPHPPAPWPSYWRPCILLVLSRNSNTAPMASLLQTHRRACVLVHCSRIFIHDLIQAQTDVSSSRAPHSPIPQSSRWRKERLNYNGKRD